MTTTQQKIGGPGGCSLEEAILAANHDSSSFTAPGNEAVIINSACLAGNGADTIELPPGAVFAMNHVIDDLYDYMGPTATPIITSDITIEGRGASITRVGTDTFRAFAVGVLEQTDSHQRTVGGLDLRELHVQGFTVTGGTGAGGGAGGLGAGGAIYVHEGSLRVQWSTFEGNGAVGGDGSGGNTTGAGGGGGGLGGDGGTSFDSSDQPEDHGGGGGGARGDGSDSTFFDPGAGGGTVVGRSACGGEGGNPGLVLEVPPNGEAGTCRGGGGGGGHSFVGLVYPVGDGGNGAYGGAGGGGGFDNGDGGDGGFGGGGGAGPAFHDSDGWTGGSGGDGGFGGGGGAGPGGTFFGEPGDGGTLGGDGADIAGGGGAGLGGAIFGHDATVEVSNSTFVGNFVVRGVAGGDGARNGADAGGAVFAVGGTLTIVNSTVSRNESTGDGAGIVVYAPAEFGNPTFFTLANTIVAGNTGRDECFLLGNVQAAGSANLVTPHPEDARAACPQIVLTADPMLGQLALNAPGRTPTMAPSGLSPVIDSADPTQAPADDQRGIARPQGANVDIGAYEYDGPPLPTDLTPPAASPTQAPPANGAGWNNTSVTVDWNWADNPNGSGIDSAACQTTSVTSAEGASVGVNASCADLAANLGTASYSVKVDLSAPTVTCNSAPVFELNGIHTAMVTAIVTDSLSGALASAVSAPVTSSDVAAVGQHTKSLTGTDVAGNTTTVDCPYLVAYRFGGFLEPIPQSSYKRGSTIPIRFRLTNAAGTPINDAAAQALLTPVCKVRILLDNVDAGCARYNASTDTFQFDLKTSKAVADGSHTLGVTVTAGSVVLNSERTTVLIRR